MADIATLTELIEPEVKSLGFAPVRVKLFGGADDRTLQIMAERSETRQLTIDGCAALSRCISELFDEIDTIEDAYRQEVSYIGSASCRERVCQCVERSGGGGYLKTKKHKNNI